MTVHRDNDGIVISVESRQVKLGNVHKVSEVMTQVMRTPETIKQHRGRIRFEVKGVGHAVDRLLNLPYVRRWVAALDNEFPYLPYFLKPGSQQFQLLAWSVLDPRAQAGPDLTVDSAVEPPSVQDLEDFVTEKAHILYQFCDGINDSPGEQLVVMIDELGVHPDRVRVQPLPPGETGDIIGADAQLEPDRIMDSFLVDYFKVNSDLHVLSPEGDATAMVLLDNPHETSSKAVRFGVQVVSLPSSPLFIFHQFIEKKSGETLHVKHFYDLTEESDARELIAMVDRGVHETYFLYHDEAGNLWSGFRVRALLDDQLRKSLMDSLFQAKSLLEQIQVEDFNFKKAVEEYLAAGEPKVQ